MVSKAVAPTPGSKYRIKVGQTIGGLVWSNVAYTVDGKWQIIYDDGEPDIWPIVQSASGSSRAAVLWTTGQIAKKNGWVIGGVVFGAAASQRGQSYVQAFVLDANYTPASITDYLAMGYAYASKPVEFGTFVEPGPAGGHGNFVRTSTAQPAAGVNPASFAVPAGAIWRVQEVQGQFVTAVAAANRRVAVQSPNANYNQYAGGAQPASVTISYNLSRGGAYSDTNDFALTTTPDYTEAPLGDIVLFAGETIQLVAITIQAADQWTGSTFLSVEEWVMPN